ncbi:hypothetical protein AGMMS50256_26040 [Betaproteobacteria bacterium]|nr:hypothetical protein AGMMS50256_26040 [Betaproteobacteria bacterium]
MLGLAPLTPNYILWVCVGWVNEAQPDKCKFVAHSAGRYERRDAPLRGFPNLRPAEGLEMRGKGSQPA